MPRIMSANSFDDEFFGGDISFGNEIDVAFVGDSRAAQSFSKNAPGIASRLNSKVQQSEIP